MFGVSTASANGFSGKLKMLKAAIQTPWFHPFPLINKNRGVFGLNLGHMWHEPEKVAVWMRDILRGVEEEWVRPHVDQAFAFADVGKAQQPRFGAGVRRDQRNSQRGKPAQGAIVDGHRAVPLNVK